MEESSGKVQAHMRSGVVMDIAAFKVRHSVGIDKDATALRAARARSSSIGAMEEMSWNLSRPARLYLEDPPPSHGVEHHSTRHLRFDSQGAIDADRRSGAHVSGKPVGARCQQDLVDRAVGDSCCELAHGACRHLVQMPAVVQMQHEGCHVGFGHPTETLVGSCGGVGNHRGQCCAWRPRRAWRTAALCQIGRATTAC
eukprot:scaffold13193_cov60-Phaeocystis_antarctica.AAC.2